MSCVVSILAEAGGSWAIAPVSFVAKSRPVKNGTPSFRYTNQTTSPSSTERTWQASTTREGWSNEDSSRGVGHGRGLYGNRVIYMGVTGMKQLSKKHWNDEMIELEKQPMNKETIKPKIPTEEEWVASGLESWDWRWRAEQAEARVKELESQIKQYDELLEQAKVGLYQVKHNFDSMTAKMRRLLSYSLKHLDPALFYYDLSSNPAVRRQQIEERTKMRHELVDALRQFLDKTGVEK